MNGLALSTRDFPIQEIFDLTGDARIERMITIAIGRTQNCTHAQETVRELLDQARADGHAAERIASGHDLGAALAVFCRRAWGAAKVTGVVVLQTIRVAFSCAELRGLQLYADVLAWEVRTGARVWSCRP
jgi:alpha-beta hydrolase superfamily lysophospholipase